MSLIIWILGIGLVLYGLYLIFVAKTVGLGIVLVIVGLLLLGAGGTFSVDAVEGALAYVGALRMGT